MNDITPSAFISYSWDNETHKDWVKSLAARLRSDGIRVILDQWHTIPGDQLPAFMEKSIRDNDYVLIICTSNYKEKSEGRMGGVGYEGDIISAEIFSNRNDRKFIPILRGSQWETCAPIWLKGKYYIALNEDPYSEKEYRILLNTLHGYRDGPPPIGKPPEEIFGTSKAPTPNSKFIIITGKDGKFYFRLTARNGEPILGSKGYKSKSSCKNDIQSVEANALEDDRYDRRKSADGQFYFILVAKNGEPIGRSEMYKTEQGRENGIESVKSNAPDAPIDDTTG